MARAWQGPRKLVRKTTLRAHPRGVLPIMDQKGKLRPKGVRFQVGISRIEVQKDRENYHLGIKRPLKISQTHGPNEETFSKIKVVLAL